MESGYIYRLEQELKRLNENKLREIKLKEESNEHLAEIAKLLANLVKDER